MSNCKDLCVSRKRKYNSKGFFSKFCRMWPYFHFSLNNHASYNEKGIRGNHKLHKSFKLNNQLGVEKANNRLAKLLIQVQTLFEEKTKQEMMALGQVADINTSQMCVLKKKLSTSDNRNRKNIQGDTQNYFTNNPRPDDKHMKVVKKDVVKLLQK